ncbi:MAG: penicillin acylase family protein [Acidobacteria bacterium]|nr:penicillin acylase family protein [Acidobacteriota bacterium]
MVTTSTSFSSPEPEVQSRRRSLAGKMLLRVLLVLALAAAGGLLWLYAVVHSALPQLDGTLPVPGLSARVRIVRNPQGVPTIEAAGLDDLFFAQGYVTAQDRLWEMDGMRRYAGGELAEIFGEDYVEQDREQRILGMRQAARKALEVSSPQARAHIEAYARGVNAYIESHRNRLPIEFRILHYAPKPWLPEDSTLIAAQMVKDLNHGSYESALQREKILAKLGPELTADLYVNSSWRDRPPTVSRASFEDEPEQDGDEDDEEMGTGDDRPVQMSALPPQGVPAAWTWSHSLWPSGQARGSEASSDIPQPALGSNNWVVAGTHTATGGPLLSNDMHLGHQMPNLWYEAHLRSGNYDVIGVTLPGMPYVIVGHNQRVAWGFTNVGPTVEDVYVENFGPDGKYQTPQGWREPEHRHEVIHVAGKPDVAVDVVITRHGPLISELVPGEGRKLALRWTLYDGIRNPFFAVNSAQNWEEFRKAFAELDAPGQNVVYADVDGNIGYQTTGKVPIRATGDGSLPVNGSDDVHEWTGYVPFEKLPSIYDPPSGMIATANGRITPDGYPYSLSVEWEAPWRTARIYRVLESGKKFTVADMLALQTDIYSEGERYFAERFVYAVDHARTSTARARQAADILREWDGRMTAKSAAPTLVAETRTALIRLLLQPKLGPPNGDPATLSWRSYHWTMRSVWLENLLQFKPARWLPAGYTDYDEVLAAAVEAAVQSPQAPKDLNSWQWGRSNALEIQHPILGRIPLLRHWSGPGRKEQSGSGYTVKAVTPEHGPSERFTADLSNWDQSTLNLVTGQAGNFLSPYYMDQWKAWYEGTTFPLPYSQGAVEKAKQHELILEPSK